MKTYKSSVGKYTHAGYLYWYGPGDVLGMKGWHSIWWWNKNDWPAKGWIQRSLKKGEKLCSRLIQKALLRFHCSSLYGPHVLTCLTTSGHAPNGRTDGVPVESLLDLDQVITELLDSTKCWCQINWNRVVLLDLGEASVGALWLVSNDSSSRNCLRTPHEEYWVWKWVQGCHPDA